MDIRLTYRVALCLLLAFLMDSCQERIIFDFGNIERRLVVDGFITDSMKQHKVRLTYSTELMEPQYEENATLIIRDELGNSHFLTYEGEGSYVTDFMAAEEDTRYKLLIYLGDSLFETGYEELPKGQGTVLEVGYTPEERLLVSGNSDLVDEEGVRIRGTIFREDQPSYYQWIIEHWFVGHAWQAPVNGWKRRCYIKDYDLHRVLLSEDEPGEGQSSDSYDVELEFIPISEKTWEGFVSRIRRLQISESSYEYWSYIREQVENVGSLFDVAPRNIYGNVFSSITAEPVLGYFGVYREMTKDIYISDTLLPFRERHYDCIIPPKITPADSANSCEDCLFIGAEHVQREKPDWWK